MDCSENDILENTISYLYEISEALPHNLPIPKSYYAFKSRILELKGQTCLPTKLTKDKVRCPRCCLKFSDYPPNVRLMPKRIRDRFTKKMLKKIEEDKPLTNYQEKFKASLQKKTDKNVLVNTCQFCKKEIKANIHFKDNKIKKPEIVNTPIVTQKKKRKKDKFAGLTPSAVLSLNETYALSENITTKKSVTQILRENAEKVKEQENKIKYPIIGQIVNQKKKKKKKTKVKSPVKSTKMKIMEKKEINADKKQRKKINNLLNTLDKPSTVGNVLSSFLQGL